MADFFCGRCVWGFRGVFFGWGVAVKKKDAQKERMVFQLSIFSGFLLLVLGRRVSSEMIILEYSLDPPFAGESD